MRLGSCDGMTFWACPFAIVGGRVGVERDLLGADDHLEGFRGLLVLRTCFGRGDPDGRCQ